MNKLNRISTRLLSFAAWVLLTLAVPAMTWAQAAPEPPSLKRFPAAWVGYAIMFGLIIAVMAISLLPSKRSHQD